MLIRVMRPQRGGDLYQGRVGCVRSVVDVHVNTLRGSRLGGSRTSSQHFQVMVTAAGEYRAEQVWRVVTRHEKNRGDHQTF
jgi:hypothetical protein